MKISSSKKYILNDKVIHSVIGKLSREDSTVLMLQKPLNRVLFTNTGFRQKTTDWIRIRTGDVGIDGFTKTTIDYKSVRNVNGFRTEVAQEMIVYDYENAKQFLEDTDATISSEQQNIRTKIKYVYEDNNFILCLDCWPWLERSMFLKIEPFDKHGAEHMEAFVRWLGLDTHEQHDLKNYSRGVDGVYKQRFGFYLMEVKDVNFDIPCPKPGKKKDEFIESSGRNFITAAG